MLFRNHIESFLSEKKLESKLDFTERKGMDQIGFNCVVIDKLSPGLWTTGKAILFIPTQIGIDNKIIIELFNVAPLTVTIGINENKIKEVVMPKIATRKIEVILPQVDATKKISELYIVTDKLWRPSVVLEKNIPIVVGICIKSIQVLS
jgi:hypothetical protein